MASLRGIPALVALGVACAIGPAAAQSYPVKPITIVVPFAAGGRSDIMARPLGQRRARAIARASAARNRPGGAGGIGARSGAGGRRAGCPLLGGRSGVLGVVPSLYGANAGFDPRKDFAPVGLIASFTQILVVH